MKDTIKEFLRWFSIHFLGIIIFSLITLELISFMQNYYLGVPYEKMSHLFASLSLYLMLSLFFYFLTDEIGIAIFIQMIVFVGALLFLFLFPRPEKAFMYSIYLLCFISFSFMLFLFDLKTESLLGEYQGKLENLQIKVIDIETSIEEKKEKIKNLKNVLDRYSQLQYLILTLEESLNIEKISYNILEKAKNLIGRGEAKLDSSFWEKEDCFDQWILKSRRPLICNDREMDWMFPTYLAPSNINSIIASPLIYQDKIHEILRLESEEKNLFSEDDLRLLSIIADLGSIALSNAQYYQKVKELSITDPLTGLYIQKFFKERLGEEIKRSYRSEQTFSLIMADLDRFKQVNDTYGHPVGDVVLREVALGIQKNIRETDMVCRYGGEEFAFLLLKTPKKRGIEIAEKIRKIIQEHKVENNNHKISVTISMGVSNYPEDGSTTEQLIEKADEALYRAKEEGRNKVKT
ncbi:MAG: GGDEF domain-containing protein [Elusimicrobia bacterium]|nr:GGDEF domain-containing protein [Elusimicrobiota bacterium]